MAFITSRAPLILSAALVGGLVLSAGCGPRKKANTSGVAATTTPATATTTATATATTPTTTTAPTTTTTATTPPTTAGTWPSGVPSIDPAVVADVLAKAAAAMGMPTAGTGAAAGDPLAAKIAANAAKYAPGFQPASAIGRAKLKTGEHAGMNFDMEAGKCYVVLGAGGAGVTQVGLFVLFPAAPPNAVMASDTAHGAEPVIGEGKPLCPPGKASVRVDTSPTAGTGDVAVQVWAK